MEAASGSFVAWSWEKGTGVFEPYDEGTTRFIEAAHRNGDDKVKFHTNGHRYTIIFGTMTQMRRSDTKKRRHVRREMIDHTDDVDTKLLDDEEAIKALGVEVDGKPGRTMLLYHMTTQEAAESIVKGGFMPSKKGMFGPLVYFAGSESDCIGKAQHGKYSGAVLEATVQLGRSLVCTKARPDMNAAELKKCLCNSVNGTQPAVSRDEFGVFEPKLIENIKVVKYYDNARPGHSLPKAQWPVWVQVLDVAMQTAPPASPHSRHEAIQKAANPWHGFQKANAGKGWSPQRMGEEYRKTKGSIPASSPPSAACSTCLSLSSSPWNEFQKANAGKGWSPQRMGEEYQKAKGSSPTSPQLSAARSTSSSSSPWNEFQKAHGGQGWSRQQMGEQYQLSKVSAPASSPLSAARSTSHSSSSSSWNEFQKARGGQGLSRQQMSEEYQQSKASAPASPPRSARAVPMERCTPPRLQAQSTSYARPASSYGSASGGGGRSSSGGGSFSGSACYAVSSSSSGPLTKSGRPDMRYKANRS